MKFYFLLSRRSFVAVICATVLFVLLLGEFKTAILPKTKDGLDNFSRVNYILSLGYKVEETPLSVKETVLPQIFPQDFRNYLSLQKDDGFPFEQFNGEEITVYDYADNQGNVITLVVSKGEIIGGHVLDGVTYKVKSLKSKG